MGVWGRSFQTEGTANAKALRQEVPGWHSREAEGPLRGPKAMSQRGDEAGEPPGAGLQGSGL